LVVDDSAYNRRTISELLAALPAVEVIGKAGDGDEALRMVAELQPDLITLDLEMPRMDGFTFLRLMMARRPTPVIVVSGYSAKENVFRALEMGALDFVAKPTRTVTSDLSGISEELAEKVEVVRQLSPAGLDVNARLRGSGEQPRPQRRGSVSEQQPTRLIVIGSSTGGPTALVEVFRRLPASTSTAVVVAQHMPERFTKTFAERLDKTGGMRVVEASDVHQLTAGAAFICPGGRCIELIQLQRGLGVKVVAPDAGDRYVPSVDRLFESAARVFGASTVGVVLTGMGDDGARGVVALRDAGGIVMAEAPETAVIYGMPGAAVRTGAVDRSLPLRAMADRLAELTST
jgi:two-component system chemotaxis response regulator CheB